MEMDYTDFGFYTAQRSLRSRAPQSSYPTHEEWKVARCGMHPGINVHVSETIMRPIINIQHGTSIFKTNKRIVVSLDCGQAAR